MTPRLFGVPDVVEDSADVRDYVVDWLRKELVGPSPGHPLVQWSPDKPALNGEEVLRPQDPPKYRYGAGILFPRGVTYSGLLDPADTAEAIANSDTVDPGDLGDRNRDGESDGSGRKDDPATDSDEEVEPAFVFLPSTMGISFLVDLSGPLDVEAKWATYEPRKIAGYGTGAGPGDKDQTLWFRNPESRRVTIQPDQLFDSRPLRINLDNNTHGGKLDLHFLSRPWGSSPSLRLLTVTLMNSGEGENRNEACFFQCGFSVECVGTHRILPYPERPESQSDEEELSLRLLYRHRPVYAVGHGCAADWSGEQDGGQGALKVRSEVLPIYEQAPIAPLDVISGVDLSMRRMAEADEQDILASCTSLADEYSQWIENRRRDLSQDQDLSTPLRNRGTVHLDQCEQCLRRMKRGIELLRTDQDAMTAFRLMNRSMVEQRAHYALASESNLRRGWTEIQGGYAPERKYCPPDYPYKTAWRPFQLAFVLMNIEAFVDEHSAERDLVDVIWFPTGGGKTEAYLGLAAFAILFRRLLNPANSGTTVLMRYTLRLLTTQQFQRAASLICALEILRREEPSTFGHDPISIGLWLGSGVTPNRNTDAVADHSKLGRGEGDNRFIVLSCPWCGVDMGPKEFGSRVRLFGYEKEANPALVRFRCEDPDCAFHGPEGLPLEVVDERIYSKPPTMLIGTVDKFAMMPWQPEARRIFGIDADGVSPPDLVIQDELHLIAGPLGSMVGHYETVIDELCARTTDNGLVGAKIVASTATISHATEQVAALYNRPASLFPPQGLRAGESFFAVERTDIKGRLYVGVLGSALSSHVVAQIRTIAALLQAPALLSRPACEPVSDDFRDPYWTLMAYFNSLRELGRAATLIQADIREYLNAVWDRIGLTKNMIGEEAMALRRFINRDEELTSRLRSGDIPGTLQKLFTSLPSRDTVDLCLATNMIQVGLDVPRLSIMTIVGQPKTASEYIQASSRVGRDRGKPGLVVTNYNPFKPRDRSHFESFRSYHENVYRHVEPTSVTPFSIPVSERAIHALAVTLARFRDPLLLDSPQAGVSAATRKMIREVISRRAKAVSAEDANIAIAKLDEFLDTWNRFRPQSYGDFAGGDHNEPLLWPAGKAAPHDDWLTMKPTMSSMRNVDAESEAYLLRQYHGSGVQ